MAQFKDSRTWANLMAAFAGESQANTKYGYYASQARKDGYNQIGDIFELTSHNESEHAKLWFKLLHNGAVPKTDANLADAIEGENFEWTSMYKGFAEVAREEGYADIAAQFDRVAAIEKEHEGRYQHLLDRIKNGQVYRREDQQKWICMNCGHTLTGLSAPQACPVCAHPQAYFQIEATNF